MQEASEMWVWSLGRDDPLEGGMATHSSILAGKISWTKEPGWLQSMESRRVRHNWTTKHSTANHHQVNGLKHQVKCFILPFWKSEVYLGYQGLTLKLSTELLSLREVLGDIPFPAFPASSSHSLDVSTFPPSSKPTLHLSKHSSVVTALCDSLLCLLFHFKECFWLHCSHIGNPDYSIFIRSADHQNHSYLLPLFLFSVFSRFRGCRKLDVTFFGWQRGALFCLPQTKMVESFV